ncbi:HAD family hydrolase [Cumulibacter soli]|uniref:HAD family hydrolase n=1 Tax=Cumulibacter soli TaxID=2546344 RepID=UPI001067637D|nr:HAD family hydrolase [Cumulibacter soli]
MREHKRAARMPGWLPKLVATDLDGTYICHGHGLSVAHRAARDWLESIGVPVVPVTGRGPRLLDLTRAQIGEDGLLIMGQGGIVYDGRTLLHRASMSGAVALRILREVRERLDDVRIGAEDADDFTEPLRLEHGFVWPFSMDESINVDARDVVPAEVLKVFVESQSHDVDLMVALIRSFVPPEVAYVTHSGIGFVEISPPNVSKAAGVRFICERYGIDHADVLCFGDMPNDLPMFEWSGRAVAMGDGHPDVLAAADDVAAPACDIGIARYIAGLFDGFRVPEDPAREVLAVRDESAGGVE